MENNINNIFTCIILFLLGVAVGYIISQTLNKAAINKTKETMKISSFEECVKAGYEILESNPPQCRAPDGSVFTSKNLLSEEEVKAINNQLKKVEPTSTPTKKIESLNTQSKVFSCKDSFPCLDGYAFDENCQCQKTQWLKCQEKCSDQFIVDTDAYGICFSDCMLDGINPAGRTK